jgi:hypothetical protein
MNMKKGLVKCVLFLFTGVLCLGLVEWGLRKFYPQNLSLWYKTRDGLVMLRPNYKGIVRGTEWKQEVETNSFGMRDREHKTARAGTKFRILVLGDSFMEAIQVKFDRSFPKLLEDRLSVALKREIEVINAAVSGWGTDEELTYLERYGRAFKPDLILVAMTLQNDLLDNMKQNFHVLVNNRVLPIERRDTPFVAYKFWQLRAFLSAKFHTYQLFRRWWHSTKVEQGSMELNTHVLDLISREMAPQVITGWRITQELLRKIKVISDDLHAQMSIILIPLTIQLDDANLSQLLLQRGLAKSEICVDEPQRIMRQFGQAEKIEVIDLLPSFREEQKRHGKTLILKYDGHWSEAGHAIAARVVSRNLVHNAMLMQEQSGNVLDEDAGGDRICENMPASRPY